jgi:hypothetical protein
MIFYKALKYKIIEFCLDRFMDGLNKNLNTYKLKQVPIESFYAGLRLSRMFFYGYDAYNCTITKVTPELDGSNTIWYYIEFDTTDMDPSMSTEIAICKEEQEDGDFAAYL